MEYHEKHALAYGATVRSLSEPTQRTPSVMSILRSEKRPLTIVSYFLFPLVITYYVSRTDLFNTENLDMNFPELLKLCSNVNLDISDEQIKQVEKDTRSQAKGSGFFRHRAGRIGASVSGVAFHSNLPQPPQSCVKSVCYPSLYKLNTKE